MRLEKYSKYVLGILFATILLNRLIGYLKKYSRGVLIDDFLLFAPMGSMLFMIILMFLTLRGSRGAAIALALFLCLILFSNIYSYIQVHFSDLNILGVCMAILDLVTLVYLYLSTIRKR